MPCISFPPVRRAPVSAAAAVCVALWLAACAAPAPDGALREAWDAHLRWLQGLDGWRAAGRLVVDVPGQGFSATMQWRQNGAEYRIHLSGPFGQGAVLIEGGEAGVVLRTADGRVARAADPEQLVAAELGVTVPVSGLRYWLVGRPAPGPAAERLDLDRAGRLEALDQAGWQVRYQDYADTAAGALPARLTLTREGVEARFSVSRWQLGG